jgi:hypothetical protein
MATVYPQRQVGRISAGVDGTVWQYTPPTLTQITTAAGATPSLGTAIAVVPTTVLSSAGFWYVMTTTAGVSTLLKSTGSTQAGITGNAYLLTWS